MYPSSGVTIKKVVVCLINAIICLTFFQSVQSLSQFVKAGCYLFAIDLFKYILSYKPHGKKSCLPGLPDQNSLCICTLRRIISVCSVTSQGFVEVLWWCLCWSEYMLVSCYKMTFSRNTLIQLYVGRWGTPGKLQSTIHPQYFSEAIFLSLVIIKINTFWCTKVIGLTRLCDSCSDIVVGLMYLLYLPNVSDA